MASKTASLFLLAFLFAAAATPLASSSFLYKGENVQGLRIVGRVVCPPSPCPPYYSHGIAGVNVVISCNGGSTSVTQVLTNSTGFFDAVVTTADGVSFDQSGPPCFATVQLPHDKSCSVFLPKSIIRAAVDLVGTLVQLPTGLFANAVATHFVPA